MAWPSSDVPTTAMDEGTDVPPRAVIKAWADAFNQIRNHVSTFMRTVLDDADAAAARTTLDVYSKAQVDAAMLSAMPVGSLLMWPTNTPPTGFVKRNGAALNRSTYAALFAVIGTTYGAGNGTTTFNVPDDRGEFERGWDDGRGVDPGRAIGSLQADELRSHTHTNPLSPLSGQAATGTIPNAAGQNSSYGTGATGGSETRPRNRAYLPIIKF